MREIFETWKEGVSYLIGDELISFYAFFTVIVAECAYVWTFEITSTAVWLTVILLAYIANVLVFAWLKGFYEGTKQETLIGRFYVVNFIILFIIGCVVNIWLNIVLTLIAFAVMLLWINIRIFQVTCFVGYTGIVESISNFFRNGTVWIISQILVIGLPYATFTWLLALIPEMPLLLKIGIPIVYFICIPFISYIEDNTAACNIFEIAHETTLYEEFEKMMGDK